MFTSLAVNAKRKVDHLEPLSCYDVLARIIKQEERKMFKMVDKEFIRKLHHMEDWSIRKISRQLQIVMGQLAGQDFFVKQKLFDSDVLNSVFILP